MDFDDFETTVRIVVVGDGCVGKSSLLRCYCKGKTSFSEKYKKTIGVNFLEKQDIEEGGEEVTLHLWDTAGQAEFKSVNEKYLKQADGAVLVFSSTDRDSFNNVRNWHESICGMCGKIPMAIVQNKVDLLAHADVHPEEAEALARDLRLKLFRVSCKDAFNVRDVFRYIAGKFVRIGGASMIAAIKAQIPVETQDIVLEDAPTSSEGHAELGQDDSSQPRSAPASSGNATEKNASSPLASPSSDKGLSPTNKGGNGTNSKNSASQQKQQLTPSKRRTGGKKASRCTLQ